MADMKEEFWKLGADAFLLGKDFVSFFTVKRVATLLIVGLALFVVCSPHDTPINANEPVACDAACPLPGAEPEPPPIHTEVLSQENWSFTLIGDGWAVRDVPTPEIMVARENHNFMCMTFVVKEATNNTYPEYVVSTIRGFAEADVTIDAIKQVTISGQRFTLAQLNHDDEVVWAWITVKDGSGYGFTCGCEINVDAGAVQRDLCQAMADTFVIK